MTSDAHAQRRAVLSSVRTALGVTGNEQDRRDAVAAHMQRRARHLLPERAKLPKLERLRQLTELLEGQGATIVRIDGPADLPGRLAEYLRGKNLPLRVRHGDEPLWRDVPWDREPSLVRESGAAVGTDSVGLSRAFAGISETGTLVLASGSDNPTTLNFLPETHVIVVREGDVVGAYEDAWDRLRGASDGKLPRAVNFVSGPSRTADIEQQLVMGAHGPRRMLVMLMADQG
jgi:L-lactate dehydrogenase complex protein LldG